MPTPKQVLFTGFVLLGISLPLLHLPGVVFVTMLGAGVAVAGICYGFWVSFKNARDPYCLQALRDLQERDEIVEAEINWADEPTEIVCLGCAECFSRDLPMCPRCGRQP